MLGFDWVGRWAMTRACIFTACPWKLFFRNLSIYNNWMPVQKSCRSRCSLESQELARQRLPKVWHRRLSPVMFPNSCKAVVDSDQCRLVSTNLFLHRSSLGLVQRRNASVWHAVLFYSRCVRYLQYLLILSDIVRDSMYPRVGLSNLKESWRSL